MSGASSDKRTALKMWFAVAAGFLLLGLGWTVLFRVAHSAHIESVPLEQKGGRP